MSKKGQAELGTLMNLIKWGIVLFVVILAVLKLTKFI